VALRETRRLPDLWDGIVHEYFVQSVLTTKKKSKKIMLLARSLATACCALSQYPFSLTPSPPESLGEGKAVSFVRTPQLLSLRSAVTVVAV